MRALPSVLSAAVLLTAAPARAGSLDVTYTTTANGGSYAPKNIVAVWVENGSGNFVDTIDLHAGVRMSHLVAWTAKAMGHAPKIDAVSGATRQAHGTLSKSWDLTNYDGLVIPDGTYTVRMELADSNASAAGQNHQGTFTFTKGATGSTTTTSDGGFTGVTLTYTPSVCGNDVVEGGETCDPMASCPASCPDSGAACAPNLLVGDAADCNVACQITPISACANGDGCCPTGCIASSDDDCTDDGNGGGDDGSGTGGSHDLTGSACAAGGGDAGSALLLGALVAVLAPRRRRAGALASRS